MSKKGFGGFSFSNITSAKTNESLKKMGAITLGLAVGTVLNTFLQKKAGLNGETILGLNGNGNVNKFLIPGAIGAIGVVASQLVKGSFAKDAAIGIAAAGASGLINRLTEKALVSLSGDDEMIPGLGEADPLYEQLPTYGGQPQEYYETQPAEYVQDDTATVAPESGETISGVDDDNFFIA